MMALPRSLFVLVTLSACGATKDAKDESQPTSQNANSGGNDARPNESAELGANTCDGMQITEAHRQRVAGRFYVLGLPNGITTTETVKVEIGGGELANFAFYLGSGDTSTCKSASLTPGVAGQEIVLADPIDGGKVFCFEGQLTSGEKKVIQFPWQQITAESEIAATSHRCLTSTTKRDETLQTVRLTSQDKIAALGLNGLYDLNVGGDAREIVFGNFGSVTSGGSMTLDAEGNRYASAVTFRRIFAEEEEAKVPRLFVSKHLESGEMASHRIVELAAEIGNHPARTDMAQLGNHVYVAVGASLVSEAMGPTSGGFKDIRILKYSLDGELVLDRTLPVGPQAKLGGMALASDGTLTMTVSSTTTT